MKGYSKFGEVGHDVPQWLQDLLIQFKKGLTPPSHPIADRILVYNASTGLVNWIAIGTSMTVSDGIEGNMTVSDGFSLPIGAVVLTTGADPSTIYGFGTWSQII